VSPAPGPLAYAFWHWKRADVAREVYEAKQRAFQEALAGEPPPGFRGASTVRLSGAGWAAGGGAAYEDWYLVDDMAALERLNEAAVTSRRQGPHDSVAALAAGGTAGLYGLRGGAPLPVPRFGHWFAKPAGMTYQVLTDRLGAVMGRTAVAWWSRRMTLGPTPEFCLQSAEPVEFPSEFVVQRLVLEPIWSGSGSR
jgi:hypothetical protein